MRGWRTTVTMSNDRSRYSRGPWLAVTRSLTDGSYALQWYWSDGAGGARYNPPLPGHRYQRRKDAERAKRQLVSCGEPVAWVEWPSQKGATR